MSAHDLKLTIEFLSDWHVGTGSGRPGSIDRLICRDEHDLPMVPGKTLAGMWRDAAESLAEALDRAKAGTGTSFGAWVSYLFGDEISRTSKLPGAPRPSRLRVDGAHLEPAVAATLRGPSARVLRESLTFVVASVSIDNQTLAAVEGHLSMSEVARKGLRLEATATLNLSGGAEEASSRFARTFLLAAAEGIERLGGKRRRGRGECRVRALESADGVADFFHQLAGAPSPWPPELPKESAAVVRAPLAVRGTSGSGYTSWPLRLRALDALQIPSRTVGNVVESLPFVPGTLLLPILARLVGDQVDVFAALRDGELIVRNAYLLADCARLIPAPKCYFRSKRGHELRSALAQADIPHGFKQLAEGFVPRDVSTASLPISKVELSSRTHNTVSDASQRPEDYGVYTYDAIAVGSRLASDVLVMRGSAVAEALARYFAVPEHQTIHGQLGRSKNREYGRVELQVGVPKDWEFASHAATRTDEVLLWLASPWLVRGPTLRLEVSTATLEASFAKALGLSGQAGVRLDERRSFVRARRIDSWQRSWGLPRPSLPGVAEGSVLVFRIDSPLADLGIRLQKLQATGVGERRGEGFGEVIVNPPWLVSPPWSEKELLARDGRPRAHGSDSENGEPEISLADRAESLLRLPAGPIMVLAAARAELERNVVAQFVPGNAWDHKEATNAMLGRLRAAVTAAEDDAVVGAIENWIHDGQRERRVGGLSEKPKLGLLRPVEELLSPSPGKTSPREAPAKIWALTQLEWLPVALREELYPVALKLVIAAWCRNHFRAREKVRKEVTHGS